MKARKPQNDLLKKVAEAPADVLEGTIEMAEQLGKNSPPAKLVAEGRSYWHMLGPGLTTGASDDDPSGIATYSQTGAQYGFRLLWLAPLTFPLMAIVQEMCARIGLVTGRGLAGNIRAHLSRRTLYVSALLLFAANTFNLGADLGAMARGVQLIRPTLSFPWVLVGFAFLSLLLQIFTPYVKYARYLKWLALILLAYVGSSLMAHLNWHEVARHAVIPSLSLNKNMLLLVAAILGTTISPYLFFWQTSQEIEEQILQGKTTIPSRLGADKADVKSMRIDVWSGMFLSNLVMFFIIAACAAVLFTHGITNITSASQAAEALRPFAGGATYWLFALGIIGTGLLAVPVLAGSASYALSESFRWSEGLYRNLKHARAFYGIIIFSLLIGLGLNFIGLNPIRVLIYSAVGNAIVSPIVLYAVVKLSSNPKVMGEWVNKRTTTWIGWVIAAVMLVAGLGAIYSLF